jgi:hypothetical protein
MFPFQVGILSSYSRILLWTLFIRLDSLRYPLKTYADIVERIYGRFACHMCNLLQAMQLLIGVCSFHRAHVRYHCRSDLDSY